MYERREILTVEHSSLSQMIAGHAGNRSALVLTVDIIGHGWLPGERERLLLRAFPGLAPLLALRSRSLIRAPPLRDLLRDADLERLRESERERLKTANHTTMFFIMINNFTKTYFSLNNNTHRFSSLSFHTRTLGTNFLCHFFVVNHSSTEYQLPMSYLVLLYKATFKAKNNLENKHSCRSKWSMKWRVPGRPKKTWTEIVEKDRQAYELNKEHVVDRKRWTKQIRDNWWPWWVWVGECFFWYQLTKSREP